MTQKALWRSKILAPVGILGFGIDGKSTYAFLKKQGISVVVFDQNKVHNVPFNEQITGLNYLKHLNLVKTLFRSSGINPNKVEIQEFVKTGGKLTSQVEFFSDFLSSYPQIIAITGTVGKGTCCTLLTRMLEASGRIVHLVGNIGKPVLDIFEKVKPNDWIVLELSSFQLSTFKKRFKYSVVLEITTEHLNWHVNKQEYWECKANLIRNQIDKDYLYYYPHDEGSQWISDLSQANKKAVEVFEEYWFLAKNKIVLKEHNLQAPFFMKNAAIVSQVALDIGITPFIIQKTILSFQGLPHRLEFYKQKNGILFYNDSNATCSESTIGALQCFSTEPLALILGGSSKETGFSTLIKKIHEHPTLAFIALIGETALELSILLNSNDNKNLKIEIFENLQKAVLFLVDSIKEGVVLLSPACASFGMFKNYQDRGEAFKKIVSEL